MLYRFGDFELDTTDQSLRYQGEMRALGPKAFATLQVLLQNAGKLVLRQALVDAVWPDTAVTDGSLSTAIKEVRKALDDAAGEPVLIRTVHRRGYRFEGALRDDVTSFDRATGTEAEAAPTLVTAAEGRASSTAPVPMLVGRARELERGAQLVRALLAGEGRGLLLSGAQGMGKTALARHIATQALDAGALVQRSHCRAPGAPPLWPIVQLLERLERTTQRAQAAEPAARARGAARAALDELNVRPDAPWFSVAPRIADALAEASAEQPLLCWFEDLNEGHPSLLAFVAWLSHELDGTRVALLATARDRAGVERAPPHRLEALELAPLDAASSHALIQLRARRPLGPICRARIVELARGNPCWLERLVDSALAALPPGGTEPDEAWLRGVPAPLRELIAARLGSLSNACATALGAAACLGSELGVPQLAAVLELPEAHVAALLDEAASAGLLEPASSGSRRRFSHDAYATAIHDALPHEQRARVHARIASLLEAEAVRGATGGLDTAARAELLLLRARSQQAAGNGFSDLQRTYRRAFDLALEAGSAELSARAALGLAGCRTYAGVSGGADPVTREEVDVLRRALLVQPEHGAMPIILRARLGLALSATDDVQQSRSLLRDALDAATHLGDPRTLGEALLLQARSLAGPGEFAQRSSVAEEAIAIGEGGGFAALVREARFELANARLRGGLMTAAELDALAEPALPPVDADAALQLSYFRILRAHARAELSELEELLEAARPLAARTAPAVVERALRDHEWELGRLRGHDQVWPSPPLSVLARYRPARWLAFVMLAGLLDRGHLRAARRLSRALAPSLSRLPKTRTFFPALGVAVWSSHVLDDPDMAKSAYRLLLPYANEQVMLTDGHLRGPVDHILGVAALTSGWLDRADIHFDRALARCAVLDIALPRLITTKYRALLLRAGGHEQRAAELVGALRDELRVRGLFGLERDLDADLERAEGRVSRTHANDAPPALGAPRFARPGDFNDATRTEH